MEEILRKYIRYTLNEKPWSADLVASLIQLKKASMLDDSQIGEILNEISRRIVREKGNFRYCCFHHLCMWSWYGPLPFAQYNNALV